MISAIAIMTDTTPLCLLILNITVNIEDYYGTTTKFFILKHLYYYNKYHLKKCAVTVYDIKKCMNKHVSAESIIL